MEAVPGKGTDLTTRKVMPQQSRPLVRARVVLEDVGVQVVLIGLSLSLPRKHFILLSNAKKLKIPIHFGGTAQKTTYHWQQKRP
jgi:hypothetical protein